MEACPTAETSWLLGRYGLISAGSPVPFFVADGRPKMRSKLSRSITVMVEGRPYVHDNGFRWHSSEDVKLKRFGMGVYVHQVTKDNSVWYDDMALSAGYLGPGK